MSTNTIEENQRRCQLKTGDKIWLFGYGSLIYLVDFPYLDAKPASIQGWSRRFWQGSHDHRGTPQNPGRVVTLIEEEDAICGGLAYLVEASVFRQLDVREKNGYGYGDMRPTAGKENEPNTNGYLVGSFGETKEREAHYD